MNSDHSILPPAAPTRLPLTWGRASALAALAIYGPHLVMALAATALVSCPHCRMAVWTIMPAAPAIELTLLLFRSSGGHLSPLICGVVSLFILAGVALLLRRMERRRWLVFSAIAIAFSAGAALLLAMIRA